MYLGPADNPRELLLHHRRGPYPTHFVTYFASGNAFILRTGGPLYPKSSVCSISIWTDHGVAVSDHFKLTILI